MLQLSFEVRCKFGGRGVTGDGRDIKPDTELLCCFTIPSRKWAFYVVSGGLYDVDEPTQKLLGINYDSTWVLGGIQVTEDTPNGVYACYSLAQFDNQLVQFPIYNIITGKVESVEAEKVILEENFKPCTLTELLPLYFEEEETLTRFEKLQRIAEELNKDFLQPKQQQAK